MVRPFLTSSAADRVTKSTTGMMTGAVEALWPLAEGTFVSQLIARLPAEQLPDLALFYHRLLGALPALAPAAGSDCSKEEQRFVNALVQYAARTANAYTHPPLKPQAASNMSTICRLSTW